MSKKIEMVVVLLLVLATVQCTRAIFFDNVSWIHLHEYADGTERMPFQGRVALMYVLRLADRSKAVTSAAEAFDRTEAHQRSLFAAGCRETITPEKLVSLVLGILCDLAAVAALWIYARRAGWLRWLPAALLLVILYVSFAARYEEAYWYPYDLPHLLFFGLATMALLEGPVVLFFPCFLLDVPIRETALFLLVPALPLLARRWGIRRALLAITPLLAFWLGEQMLVHHAFAHNPSETGVRFALNLRNLAWPLHWPQMASVLGFLLLPVWLGRRYLERSHQIFLWAMLPGLAVSAVFGIWVESRVVLEWSMSIAWLASLELMGAIKERSNPESPAILPG